jgi:hypothetical protein
MIYPFRLTPVGAFRAVLSALRHVERACKSARIGALGGVKKPPGGGSIILVLFIRRLPSIARETFPQLLDGIFQQNISDSIDCPNHSDMD